MKLNKLLILTLRLGILVFSCATTIQGLERLFLIPETILDIKPK